MIGANLPALQVVLPLIAAPLCVVLGRSKGAWLLATAVSWAALLVAIAILMQVAETGVWSYEVGGWPAPWGIEIRIDLANAYVLLIITVISSIVLPYARQSVAAEISEAQAPLFYSMYLLCFCGLLGITVTGDAFNLFVFLEISSLSSYVLIAMGRDRRALTASYQYLIMGTIGATFYLIGVGLLYHGTGTLNMADLAARIQPIEELKTVHAAFAFLLIGLAIKAAIFPLHMWLPNAYCYAPSVVTAFLAATATKVSIYVLIRVTTSVFTPNFSFEVIDVGYVLAPLALAAMLVASTIAIFQTNVKRLLAYSSVAQIGYMILGVSLGTVAGLTAGLVHLFNHAMIKGGAVHGARLRGSEGRRDRRTEYGRVGPGHALDHGGLRNWWTQPDRRTSHHRFHQQMAPDPGVARGRTVDLRGAHRDQLDHGNHLRLADHRGRLLPRPAPSTRGPARGHRGADRDAAADLASDPRQPLLRDRYGSHRRGRRARRPSAYGSSAMIPETAAWVALVIPLIGAIGHC